MFAAIGNLAGDTEIASWILATQSFASTIEAAENNRPAFVVAQLQQLAGWHEWAARPYTLTDLVWNVREARVLLDRSYIIIERHRADLVEYGRKQLELAQDFGKVANEIATEIAPRAVAQWDRGDITEPVKSVADSFIRWGEWRLNQPVSVESEIVAGVRSSAIDAALLFLDQLLESASTSDAQPKLTATVRKMSKAVNDAKLEADVTAFLDKHDGEKFGIRDVHKTIHRSTGSISGSKAWKRRGKKATATRLTNDVMDTIPTTTGSPQDEMMGAPRMKALEQLLSQVPMQDLAKMGREKLDQLVDLTAESITQADRDEGKHFQQRPEV